MNELLEEIESLTIGKEWRLDTEYLLDFLSVTREQYAKFVYSRRRQVMDSLEVRDYYTQDSVNELISILEAFDRSDAAAEFFSAGYYLPSDKEIFLQELFISVSLSRMQSQNPDRELLETILSGCSDYRDAFDAYLQSEFPVSDLIRYVSDIFLIRSGMEDHYLSRHILQQTLLGLIQNKIIRLKNIYQSAWRFLTDYCLKEGLLNPEEVIDSEYQTKHYILPDDIRNALRELELSETEIPSEEDVKKNFRRLLKKHHPDRNPAGTEKTRTLNASYAVLLSFCAERTSS